MDRHARVASPHCRGMGRGRLLSRELGSATTTTTTKCVLSRGTLNPRDSALKFEIHSPLDLTQVWCEAARWQGRGRLTSSIMQVMPTAALPQDIMLAVLFSIRIARCCTSLNSTPCRDFFDGIRVWVRMDHDVTFRASCVRPRQSLPSPSHTLTHLTPPCLSDVCWTNRTETHVFYYCMMLTLPPSSMDHDVTFRASCLI